MSIKIDHSNNTNTILSTGSPVTMPSEMATYRQVLRDLPETIDINNQIFPENPITKTS